MTYDQQILSNDHPMIQTDIIVSNTYTNEIEDKFRVKANFLIDNNYPVNTDDATKLAEFLRQQEENERKHISDLEKENTA